MDHLTPERRSWNMSRIRNKNTKPEILVRSLLHRMGYRFTVNAPNNRKLPGKPDIVLPKYKAIIFVHGCFWHRHKGCKETTTPKSRTEWWQAKFDGNLARDRKNQRLLERMLESDRGVGMSDEGGRDGKGCKTPQPAFGQSMTSCQMQENAI